MIALLSKYAGSAAGIPLANNAFELIKSSSKKSVPFDFVQRAFSRRGEQGDAGGWPSTTGNPSGGNRSNNPPKKYTEQDRDRRGRYIMSSLYEDEDVNINYDEEVTSIACGGKATIMLYENGETAWTTNLTTSLYNKLNGRQNSLPPPEYVAIGSQDRYYVRFTDGSSQWVGDDAMTKKLRGTNRRVKSVAFGEHWDSHFIVYDDEYWQYRNIPAELRNILEEEDCKADLDCVSLGPDGEYYMSATNGTAWWGGTTDENIASIAKVRDRVQFIDFADDDAFLCRYT